MVLEARERLRQAVDLRRDPEAALSDKDQALTPAQFTRLVQKARALAAFMAGQPA